MRDFLTGIAIVLIVILTAALAAPYFIDWNGQRGFLEARLSRALGQRVTVGGAIDLKLLPTPYLVLDQTVIGGDDGAVTIGIRHLDLELSVAPLLYGEFDIIEARLEEPTIRMTLGRERTLPALPSAPAFTADVRFDRIDIADGTLAVADPSSGRTFVFDHLDLSAEAPALAGPYKGSGSAGEAGARTAFRFATTTAQNGKTRLRFTVGETNRHPGFDLDGAAALTPAADGGYRQDFDGALAVSGHTALSPTAGDPAGVPWRLSGPFKAGPKNAMLAGGELRLGTEDAGLSLQAQASGDFDDDAQLALTLSAKQLDIDRLSGAPVDAVRPPPPRLPDLAGLRDALLGATPPLPTTVDLAVDNATWGGDTLSGMSAHWTKGGRDPQILRFAADGPGGSHLAADGLLSSAAHAFTGRVDASADNLPATLAWLSAIDPAFHPDASALPSNAVGFSGHVMAGGEGIDADALTARLGPSTLTGAARFAFAKEERPAKLGLDLRARTLAVETLPSVPGLRAAAEPYDLDVRVAADRLTLAGDTPLATGPVILAFTKSGRAVAITRLDATDLGGATIDGDGRLDAEGARLTLTIDAARLEAATSLLRRVAPGPAVDALAARAPALVPAKLKIDLSLSVQADGSLRPGRVSVSGHAGGTAVVATLAPSDEGAALEATLDAPEGGTLLRQLGAATLPVGAIGPSRVVVRAHGRSGQPSQTTLSASLGATKLDVAGRYDLLAADGPSGSGTARLTSPDLAPLLQTLALAFPDLAGRVPADVAGGLALDHGGVTVADGQGSVAGVVGKGSVTWRPASGDTPALSGRLDLDRLSLASVLALALGPSHPALGGRASTERFAGGLVDPPRAALALKIETLDLPQGPAATNASLDLGIAPNLLTLKHLSASLAEGRVAGDLALRRAAADATFEGKIALDKVRVNVPGADTLLTETLDFAGAGSSPSALLASLAGSGTARAAALRIARADPLALPKVFADIEADTLAVDAETIVRALDEGSQGPLALGDRGFDLSLANGVLHVTPSKRADDARSLRQGPVAATADAAIDLRSGQLDEQVRETLLALPPNWTGAPPSITIGLQGPIEDPRRLVDVSALVDAVATRALARETTRIEAYEFDIRERAFFSQRLQSEQRREQDRLKAEDDALKAEADRRARAEAARLERLRKEDAARATAARSEQTIRDAIQAQGAAAKAAREKAIEERASGESPRLDRANRPETPQEPEGGSRFEAPQPGTTSDPTAAGRY